VSLIKSSRAEGGTKRSPFLTAPFNKIVRALGDDKILIQAKKGKERSQKKI
jgi:hypothetical protein